jgi:hypothetical protein
MEMASKAGSSSQSQGLQDDKISLLPCRNFKNLQFWFAEVDNATDPDQRVSKAIHPVFQPTYSLSNENPFSRSDST